MDYNVRNATWEDLPRIEELYANARRFMAETGNPNQWGNTTPVTSLLEDDISKGYLHVMVSNGIIHGVFYFYIGIDPTYGEIEDGSWTSDTPYGTIHRIAGDGSGGTLATAVAFAKERINHIRIDTHEDNKIMQRCIAREGFTRCGIIHLANGSPRIAYALLTE